MDEINIEEKDLAEVMKMLEAESSPGLSKPPDIPALREEIAILISIQRSVLH